MKKLCLMLSVLLSVLCFAGCGSTNGSSNTGTTQNTTQLQTSAAESTDAVENNSKILVAYFSATGNTKAIAESVAQVTGADLFEIVPTDEYTDADLDYNNDNCRANKEQNDSTARPKILNTVDNMDSYDVVIIGHPIWWGVEPRVIDTFIESYDFSGKTVASFCTSGGSGIEKSEENLKALCPQNTIWAGSNRFYKDASVADIESWISEININSK